MPATSRVTHLGFAAVIILASSLRTAYAQSPERDGTSRGLIRWKNTTTITVYVPDDPDKAAQPGRRAKVIAGMKIWFEDATLKDRGIKIDVTGVKPAASVKNVVTVRWAAAGSLPDGHRGEGGPAYDPAVKDANGNHNPTGGEIDIDRGVTDLKEAFNAGAHEMGHVLGLSHGDSPIDVMFKIIRGDDELSLSDRNNNGAAGDVAELKATYAANFDDTKIDVVATALAIGPVYRYTYAATWLSGGPLAVFQVDTHGAALFDITPAPGWMVDDFAPPDDWLERRTGVGTDVFLGFVHQRDEFNLDDDNRQLTFAFSSLRPPGATEAFFNGSFQTIGPAIVPEPSTVRLLALGVLCLIGAVRKTRK